MPLARIIAPIAEFYERLAQDLRAQGFDVQNGHPGQFFPEAADLEISVKQCAPEEAARLASDAAALKDMCVLVSPLRAGGRVRSVELIVVQPRAAQQAEPAGITPAQVIEISSALARSNEPVEPSRIPPSRVPPSRVQSGAWRRAGKSARSSWTDISRTTNRWLEVASATCHSGWHSLKQAGLPVRGFFWEIGDESKQLYHKLAALLSRRNAAHRSAEDDDQLIPSLFHLSDELDGSPQDEPDVFEHQVVVQMPARPVPSHDAGRSQDTRFLKVAGAAAVVAIAALLSVSALRRESRPPAAGNGTASTATHAVTGTASPTPKPSAAIEGERKSTGVQMVSARQVARDESGIQDTVVRYGRRVPARRPPASPYEIKHYSDLD